MGWPARPGPGPRRAPARPAEPGAKTPKTAEGALATALPRSAGPSSLALPRPRGPQARRWASTSAARPRRSCRRPGHRTRQGPGHRGLPVGPGPLHHPRRPRRGPGHRPATLERCARGSVLDLTPPTARRIAHDRDRPNGIRPRRVGRRGRAGGNPDQRPPPGCPGTCCGSPRPTCDRAPPTARAGRLDRLASRDHLPDEIEL